MKGVVKSVLGALDDYGAGRIESSLLKACIAVDATSKHRYGATTSVGRRYKALLREYTWLLQAMIGGGVDLQRTKFTNLQITDGKKPIQLPDVADVIYHIHRCSLVHEGELPPEFEILASTATEASFELADGVLRMPGRLIPALIALSVFARCNKSMKSDGPHLLTWDTPTFGEAHYPFLVKDWWGREKEVREIFSRHSAAPAIEIKWDAA